jgi:hypothetical protein
MAKHRVNWHLHRGDKEHHEGDIIHMDAESAEPLVKMGVLTPMDEDEETAPEVGTLSPSQLAKANKETLAQYAKQHYGVELDATEMTRDAMLAAIAEAQAKGGE